MYSYTKYKRFFNTTHHTNSKNATSITPDNLESQQALRLECLKSLKIIFEKIYFSSEISNDNTQKIKIMS